VVDVGAVVVVGEPVDVISKVAGAARRSVAAR
jgi:hypothetical protein